MGFWGKVYQCLWGWAEVKKQKALGIEIANGTKEIVIDLEPANDNYIVANTRPLIDGLVPEKKKKSKRTSKKPVRSKVKNGRSAKNRNKNKH